MEDIEISDENAILLFKDGELSLVSDFDFKKASPDNYPNHLRAAWALYQLMDHPDILEMLVQRIWGDTTIH